MIAFEINTVSDCSTGTCVVTEVLGLTPWNIADWYLHCEFKLK